MKKVLLMTTATLTLSGALAHAGYLCQSVPQGATLKVHVQDWPTRAGVDTNLELQEGSKKSFYYGALKSEGGSMYGKKVVELYPFYKGDTLTIVSKPKNCGRGFCDPANDKVISAKLKIGNSETVFYCNETQD